MVASFQLWFVLAQPEVLCSPFEKRLKSSQAPTLPPMGAEGLDRCVGDQEPDHAASARRAKDDLVNAEPPRWLRARLQLERSSDTA